MRQIATVLLFVLSALARAQYQPPSGGGGGVANVTGVSPVLSSGGANPAISLSGVTSEQGNGAKVQLSTGTTTPNDCVKFDANGNTVDNGSACGSSVCINSANIVCVSKIIPSADVAAQCNWFLGTNNTSAQCADDWSQIQTVLSTASASNPLEIVVDTSVGLSKCLVVPTGAFVTFRGLGMFSTGFYMINGSNATAIGTVSSGGYCSPGLWAGSAPATSGGLVVKDMGINGNRAGNSTGDARCSTSPPISGWCMDIAAANLKYYELSNVYLYNSPSYATDSANIDRQVYHNSIMVTPALSNSNTDGIHMDGPGGTFEIDGVYLATGDDGIAANMVEGYGGSIGGGTISNEQVAGPLTAFRTYCGGSSLTLGPITITNVNGWLSNHTAVDATALFRLGYTNAGVADCIQSVKITNADVSLQDWSFGTYTSVLVDVEDNVGDLELTNVRWHSPAQTGAWLNFTGASTVSNYTCTGCTIYQDAIGSSAAYWAKTVSGSIIKNYECNGCSIVAANGTTATTFELVSISNLASSLI